MASEAGNMVSCWPCLQNRKPWLEMGPGMKVVIRIRTTMIRGGGSRKGDLAQGTVIRKRLIVTYLELYALRFSVQVMLGEVDELLLRFLPPCYDAFVADAREQR